MRDTSHAMKGVPAERAERIVLALLTSPSVTSCDLWSWTHEKKYSRLSVPDLSRPRIKGSRARAVDRLRLHGFEEHRARALAQSRIADVIDALGATPTEQEPFADDFATLIATAAAGKPVGARSQADFVILSDLEDFIGRPALPALEGATLAGYRTLLFDFVGSKRREAASAASPLWRSILPGGYVWTMPLGHHPGSSGGSSSSGEVPGVGAVMASGPDIPSAASSVDQGGTCAGS